MLNYCYKEKEPNGDSQMAAKSLKTSNADNVKARVLHVMNVDHTKKKAEHMQQNDERQKQTMDASIFEYKKSPRRYRSFEKMDGI